MTIYYLDRVKFSTPTTGTGGTISVGAASSGFQTPGGAGAVDALVYRYKVEDTSNAWEIGYATYNAAGTALINRTVTSSSNSNSALNLSGSAVVALIAAADDMAENAYYTYAAAMLEPLAIEALQSGTFSYAVGSSATKIALATFWTRLGASGRWEARNPQFPVPLRNVTVTGLDSTSTGVFIDPALPTYTNARKTYYDRLQTIFETAPLYIDLAATNTYYTLLPGPYGSIITSIAIFDLTWIVARPYGTSLGWNLADEIGDTGSSDYLRTAHGVYIPISKNVISKILTGGERSAGVGKGSVTYINCPSTWGKVTDSTSYTFRDDFMGTSLDTSTKWTRTQSTAGNMEIQTAAGVANWLKVLGNSSWGANTITTQTSVARAAGKVLMMDVYPADSSAMYGWYDGAGTSYTDLAHAISFAGSGSIHVYEAGTDRGSVGSGYTVGVIYRIKLTLDTPSANKCKYEIQGGSQYPAIGSASWTDITPGTTSNSVTPLYGGIVGFSGPAYVSDVKMY